LESTLALVPQDYETYRKDINNYDSELYKQQKLLYLPSDPVKVILLPYQKVCRGEYLGGKILFHAGCALSVIGLLVPFGVRVLSEENLKP